MPCTTTEAIRAKIEGLMGWKRGSSNSFSFRALQTFVRGKDPEFDKEFSRYLDSGEHFFVKDKCPHGRKPEDCDACYEEAERIYTEAKERS